MSNDTGRIPHDLWEAQEGPRVLLAKYDGRCRGTFDHVLERAMERNFPGTPWRVPVRIDAEGVAGWACRYCVAIYGTGGAATLTHLPATREDAETLIRAAHDPNA